ncbi:hypothetical protein MUG84_00170 [Paenibacillus sp. KQZ6P-2]|uniref:Uncharacterized protein n=1 Tax=Paenibacillus mangrovi TaxID=2931978 RepID=A0A9X2B0R4_9BACL|nr:hypothetical protein [Paenibacillus mangrovi]MCJ8010155.1 hypothetical protein [Paenibacillus mangrovi]
MEIKNKSGNVIGKIQIQSLQDENILDNIIHELRPGDGKGIYIADAVDNKFTQQTNYAAIEWDKGYEMLRDKNSVETKISNSFCSE